MNDASNVGRLTDAVGRYFELMYDSDTSHFDKVFCPTSQLHGFREGVMSVIPANSFRQMLADRPSPKSLDAPRAEQILLMDFASETQAFVKVRVRINSIVFVDYLSYHRIEDRWLITAKAFHVESTGAHAPVGSAGDD